MAEDLPQDSSRYQETSEDLDVNAGEQAVNSVEDTAVAQGSQRNQAHTNQKNKKYDLGVLFVHGIGDQRPGDTLSAIYPKIKDEFMADGSLRYNDTQQASKTSAIDATIYNQYDGSNKNITFRESHWNNLNHGDDIRDYMSNGDFKIGFWKACKYILISLLAACVSHAKGLAAFISLVLIMRLMIGRKISQEASLVLVIAFTLVAIVICLAWVIKVGSKENIFNKLSVGIKNCLINLKKPFTKEFWYNIKFKITLLMWLYQQIDGISGDGSKNTKVKKSPTSIVWNDIQNLMNECDAVTVIAHSMGAYLSVDAIRAVQDIENNKLHLITFGSGFAPVSLLRDICQDCCRTMVFILKNILGLLLLIGSIYCSIFATANIVYGNFSAVIPYIFWGVVCGLIFRVIHQSSKNQIAKSQAIDIKDGIIWQNHSFTADLVGNSISSLSPQSDSYTIPVYKIAHKIESYFEEDSMMRKIVSSNVLEMTGVHHHDDNKYVGDFKAFRILYTIFAVATYVIMTLIDLRFKDRWLGYLILFMPFVINSIFLFRPINNYVFGYSPYLYWDKKSGVKLDSQKLYCWSIIFGVFSGMVGFAFLYFMAGLATI